MARSLLTALCVLVAAGAARQQHTDTATILDQLIKGCTGQTCPVPPSRHSEYPGYDGWYNNLGRPSLGAVDTPLLRLLPPTYDDGAYAPTHRPTNPLNISRRIMAGAPGQLSMGGKTAFLVFFGQQVVEEILDAQRPGCPPEYFNIPVPADHPYLTHHPGLPVIPFLRARYDMNTGHAPNNPRQQLNEATPYLDGGLVYGGSRAWADVLRLFSNGTLAPHGALAWHDDPKLGEGFPAENSQGLPMANPPAPTNHSEYISHHQTASAYRFFKLGNPRGNENPFLLSFGVLWFRWHNAIAKHLHDIYPQWADERVFNEARKWVIASYQSIVINDWLPAFIRTPLRPYQGYRPSTDPQISHVFQAAAMRFGHTLVPAGVYLRKHAREGCATIPYTFNSSKTDVPSSGVRTCNSYWRSPELFQNKRENIEDPSQNLERLMMGMSSQSSEREDNIIVEDLRGKVFGPLEFSRRDLMAINIQRARDHGLPDYNTARRHFGLPVLESLEPAHFKAVTGSLVDEDVLREFAALYGSADNVDIWSGGLMETARGPGPLFTWVIKDQFARLRNGDRFWFENSGNGLFLDGEIAQLQQLRIVDVLLAVTNITINDIQPDPFSAPHEGNPLPGCMQQLNNSVVCNVPMRACTLPEQPVQHFPSSPYGNSEPIDLSNSIPWRLNRCSIRSNRDTICMYLEPLRSSNLEPCKESQTFDYFSGSEAAYISTFIIMPALCGALVLILACISGRRKRPTTPEIYVTPGSAQQPQAGDDYGDNCGTAAKEVRSKEDMSRHVIVHFIARSRRIEVTDARNRLLRGIDLTGLMHVAYHHLADHSRSVIKVQHHYDLYLKFSEGLQGSLFHERLQSFCSNAGLNLQASTALSVRALIRDVTTYKDRARDLATFSAAAFKLATSNKPELSVNTKQGLQLTQVELAQELGMSPDSIIVKQLFRLMDKDNSKFIHLNEYCDVIKVLAQGSKREKAELVFNIYNLEPEQGRQISTENLKDTIKSTIGSEVDEDVIDTKLTTLLLSVNLRPGDAINFDTFFKLYCENDLFFGSVDVKEIEATFDIYGNRSEDVRRPKTQRSVEDDDLVNKVNNNEPQTQPPAYSLAFRSQLKNIYNNQVVLIWGTLFTLVMLLIFAERFYYYSVEREHTGLRRIAGYGVAVTRGAASAMMFCYSSLLVTMCRNIFTLLRSSPLFHYFPIDSMIGLHTYIAVWALGWTMTHVVGHAINFYHIATQTASDLSCLFPDFYRASNVLPKFQYWCWQTITGVTGVLLVLQCTAIYAFAHFTRRYYFRVFWITHNTYPLFYALIIMHGLGNLVQGPLFCYFFIGPALLFSLDKMISASRKTNEFEVIEAQHLPSNVTLLKIRRPMNFHYEAGQWTRVASEAIDKRIYHPFTLSSAPHEKDLTLHIRGVGPWTNRIRKEYPHESTRTFEQRQTGYPKLYLDGPFGEGLQTWKEYEMAVLIAGGIGVTPFTSILKDIAYRCSLQYASYRTKRVLFLWVTRSQKQFEWVTEILDGVEKQDKHGMIKNHIFITQYQGKLDFRSISLYMLERNWKDMSGTSLLTGLKAVTHFCRPDFLEVFRAVRRRYAGKLSNVGVFTCGPRTLADTVETACKAANQPLKTTPSRGAIQDTAMTFKHYSVNY